ncbi:MAG: hypothetical protein DPW18_01050 [Chloroflexi bacterium]|nr:hypothetical protein [Chloroflexota bacterium]MDL1945102.1 hypothetical protein [Chloroflexi bacterium CFX2]
MRIIDKTPFQDANGNINIIARIQGTLKYGMNWYPELEAQKKVIPQLDRHLDKGYVLIRNFTLPNSEIVIPLVLIASGSISVILVSPVKGHFEAKGTEWNTLINNGVPVPARRNLIDLISKLTRAFQKYLERQRIQLPVPVESVLIASDPGAQIESLRPIVRVVRSDAIKQFANAVMQMPPKLRTDTIYALGDRIVTPKTPEELEAEVPIQADQSVSRAQAIFNASETAGEFNPSEFGFEFKEEEGATPSATRETSPARPRPNAVSPAKKRGRLTNAQVFLLVGMALVECCVLAAGVVILFLFNQ